MENVSLIKKYFLTNDEMVIKYKNKKVETKKINSKNLKYLSDALENQYKFDTETVLQKQDNMYSSVTYVSFIITLLEGIIFLNLFIAFEIGLMKQFIVCSILSAICISTHFIYLIVSMILMRILKKRYKICLGKDDVRSKYEFLAASEKKIEKLKEEVAEAKEEVADAKEKIKNIKKSKLTDEEKQKKRKEDRKKKAKAKKRKARKTGTKQAKKNKK